jgi:hypothetical protein
MVLSDGFMDKLLRETYQTWDSEFNYLKEFQRSENSEEAISEVAAEKLGMFAGDWGDSAVKEEQEDDSDLEEQTVTSKQRRRSRRKKGKAKRNRNWRPTPAALTREEQNLVNLESKCIERDMKYGNAKCILGSGWGSDFTNLWIADQGAVDIWGDTYVAGYDKVVQEEFPGLHALNGYPNLIDVLFAMLGINEENELKLTAPLCAVGADKKLVCMPQQALWNALAMLNQ